MCGRYTLHSAADLVADHFDLDLPFELAPRFNVAPTQEALVIRPSATGDERRAESYRWGLIPDWARDASIGTRCINARRESVADKPAFRDSYRRRRCLVPADGFFEWQPIGGRKQPFHIRRPDRGLFALAGLWARWRAPSGQEIRSFTIVTCPANRDLEPLHDRMPVVLRPEDYAVWLDPLHDEVEHLDTLLRPADDAYFEFVPVSERVNSVAFDDPSCLSPPEQRLLF